MYFSVLLISFCQIFSNLLLFLISAAVVLLNHGTSDLFDTSFIFKDTSLSMIEVSELFYNCMNSSGELESM